MAKGIKPLKIKEQISNKVEEKQKESDNSSNLSLEDESSASFTSIQEDVIEEKVPDIFETLYLTESDSEEDEEPEYVKQKELPVVPNILAEFEELPDISDIADDTLPEEESEVTEPELPEITAVVEQVAEEAESEESEADAVSDEGRFVNPLTGLQDMLLRRQREESEARARMEQEKEMGSLQAESSASLLPLALDDEVEPAAADDTMDVFIDLHFETEPVKTEEIDFEALAREEESRMIKKGTSKFLNDLINKVVDYVEYLSPSKFLQKNLDKNKLMLELSYKVQCYYREKAECTFLNRQTTQHFRRKSSFRAITEDNPKRLEQEKLKLEEAKDRLNEVLAKEIKLTTLSQHLKQELKGKLSSLKKEAEAQVLNFENRVRKYLHREIWPKLNTDVDGMLSLMKGFRQEINQVRFSLFLNQHTDKQLVELVKKMEDLGDGLTMKTFTTMQAENQSLDKKIKDRDTELNKLYLRCQKNIHTLAHFREKRQILNEAIKFQRKTLMQLIGEKQTLRERVFSFKLQRIQIHNKMTKLREQGGILDKPALMLDYDQTVKLFTEKKETVNYLKRLMSLTQHKIDKLVQQCPTVKI